MNDFLFDSTSISDFNQFFKKNKYKWSTVFVLVDTNTHQYCLPSFLQHVEIEDSIEILEVDAGEESKDIEIAAGLWLTLNELNADRKSLIINLGGGVVCDLGGWVAANYKRGIDFMHVPTSLLAIVDASIGGKTGIDLGGVKNLIGSFTNPEMLIVENSFLDTLPQNEWESGFAEMLKHALIISEALWAKFLLIRPEDHNEVKDLIEESKDVKINIVKEDFKEGGIRKALNYGHTIGHAIEAVAIERAEPLSHGHAIALGMILANCIAKEKNLLSEDKMKEINDYLLSIYSNVPWLNVEKEKIFLKMKKDKKNDGEAIRMILLKNIGEVLIDVDVIQDEVNSAFNYLQNKSSDFER